jgi:ABC-type Zn2+ transport system substrate-binding protein/surface adhesin
MSRSTVRLFAFVILALLGAPVAMHVVIHDLHDHHDHHDHHDQHGERADAYEAESAHSDHEHPIVSSPAPRLPDATRVALPAAIVRAVTSATWTTVANTDRNVLSFGALRMDDDVGLQPLLSTFLI